MDKKFWNNKKVLITGDTGFKGSWLALALSTAGAKIQGLSSSVYNSNEAFYNHLQIQEISETADVDIRDLNAVMGVFQHFNPEIVFHLAAQPLVKESYTDPVTTFNVNISGTLNVLEAIRMSDSVQTAIFITTDKCYENNEWPWGYREIDRMGGHDPYSSSKGCAELLIKSYQRSFFNNASQSPGVSSVRAGNVIGGGDFSHDRLIPDIYRAIKNDTKVLLRSPNATRPWQHVLEPLSGYIKVAEELWKSGPEGSSSWNFGPHLTDIRSVQEVSELFCQFWGCSNVIEYDDASLQVHEAASLSLDISKAFFELKWTPSWDLNESVKRTSDWYQHFLNNGDCLELCHLQVDEYFKDIITPGINQIL